MKPHESPGIRKKSICGDSWPVWNRGISTPKTPPNRLQFSYDVQECLRKLVQITHDFSNREFAAKVLNS